MNDKPLGLVIQEVADEVKTWPAWAQPYRPATFRAAMTAPPERRQTSADAQAAGKRG